LKQIFLDGGVVMWPLLILSVLSLTFIVERFIVFGSRSMNAKPKALEKLLISADQGDFTAAQTIAEENQTDFIIRTLLHGLSNRFHSLNQALESKAMFEIRTMKRNMSVLDTIITAAPLLGILGTVMGIIHSFEVIGSQGVSDPLSVTKGISQALITTAFGLIISLGTLIPFNFFRSRIRQNTEELEKYCTSLEVIHQKHQARGSVQG
jgi:biopolymer transport protein ExbB